MEDTVDPAVAIESYVDATGKGGDPAGIPWVLVVGLVVVVVVVIALNLVMRRRLSR